MIKLWVTIVCGNSWEVVKLRSIWVPLGFVAALSGRSQTTSKITPNKFTSQRTGRNSLQDPWCIHNDTLKAAKCKSVRKPYTKLPDSQVALISASKYFQMLPGPPAALQTAVQLCKSIFRCSRKHLQLLWCIQDDTRFDNYNMQIPELLRPLHGSVGVFKSGWDLCASLQKTSSVAETSALTLGNEGTWTGAGSWPFYIVGTPRALDF